MDQLIIDRLNNANIPMTFHDVKLRDLKNSQGVEHYVVNGSYADDKKNGIGVHIYGTAQARARLFPTMARALSLFGDDVFLTQMVVVRDIARNEEHPLSEKLMNCSALFIQFFCSPGEEVPYTPAERTEIEQMLLLRATHGRRNYFSAMEELDKCTWWSEDFRANLKPYLREVSV